MEFGKLGVEFEVFRLNGFGASRDWGLSSLGPEDFITPQAISAGMGGPKETPLLGGNLVLDWLIANKYIYI